MKVRVPPQSLVAAGLGLLFAALALSIDGGKQETRFVSLYCMQPSGGEDAVAAVLSSRQRQLGLLARLGLPQEKTLEFLGEHAQAASVVWQDGLLAVEIEPDSGLDPDEVLQAAEALLKEEYDNRHEDAAGRLEADRQRLRNLLDGIEETRNQVLAKLLKVIARFPGEFNENLVPIGLAQKQFDEVSRRIRELEAALSALGDELRDPSSGPNGVERLEKELAELSLSLGPLHPRIKAVERRLASLRAARVVHPAESRSTEPALAIKARLENLRGEQKTLGERLGALPGAAAEISKLKHELLVSGAQADALAERFAALPTEAPRQEVVSLGQKAEARMTGERRFSSAALAFLSLFLGLLTGVALSGRGGVTRPEPQVVRRLPKVLLNLAGDREK